jgi:hypothetical protein
MTGCGGQERALCQVVGEPENQRFSCLLNAPEQGVAACAEKTADAFPACSVSGAVAVIMIHCQRPDGFCPTWVGAALCPEAERTHAALLFKEPVVLGWGDAEPSQLVGPPGVTRARLFAVLASGQAPAWRRLTALIELIPTLIQAARSGAFSAVGVDAPRRHRPRRNSCVLQGYRHVRRAAPEKAADGVNALASNYVVLVQPRGIMQLRKSNRETTRVVGHTCYYVGGLRPLLGGEVVLTHGLRGSDLLVRDLQSSGFKPQVTSVT